jgi:hypothetical protein
MTAGCALLLLPLVFTSACQSSPMTMGLAWLREIHSAQIDVRRGVLGAGHAQAAYWRKDIRELDSLIVNGKPAGLINSRIAASDIGGPATKTDRPIAEISLRSLKFSGEPPVDYNKYAVVMWVQEWGRMGWWTLTSSQDGVWGKPGKLETDCFPVDPTREGWLPEAEVMRILAKSKRLDRWLNFWGIK